MQTLEQTRIEIPFPEVGEPQVRLVMSAGRLRLTPGGTEVLVAGQYRDPSGWMPCHVTQNGGQVEIVQQPHAGPAFPVFEGPPEMRLTLGTAKPYPLVIESGATDGEADLGGVPLTGLTVHHGAGTFTVDFSAPNPHALGRLLVAAGAANIDLRHLGNANFAELIVEGGAASYHLDFSGALQRPATVKISAGMSSVELHIPATTAARITSQSLLGGVDADRGFTRRDGAFCTAPALAGAPALLTIGVNIALGSLHLITS